jgi:hypothetical protein
MKFKLMKFKLLSPLLVLACLASVHTALPQTTNTSPTLAQDEVATQVKMWYNASPVSFTAISFGSPTNSADLIAVKLTDQKEIDSTDVQASCDLTFKMKATYKSWKEAPLNLSIGLGLEDSPAKSNDIKTVQAKFDFAKSNGLWLLQPCRETTPKDGFYCEAIVADLTVPENEGYGFRYNGEITAIGCSDKHGNQIRLELATNKMVAGAIETKQVGIIIVTLYGPNTYFYSVANAKFYMNESQIRRIKILMSPSASSTPPTSQLALSPIFSALGDEDFDKAKGVIEADPKAVYARDQYDHTPLQNIANVEIQVIRESITLEGLKPVREPSTNIPPVAELLIAKGADVNPKDKQGFTPLILSIARHKSALAKLLIQKGADVNVSVSAPLNVEGYTPLHFAADQGDLDIAKALFTAGAKIDTKNRDGETPLFVAAKLGWSGFVEFLLQNGADVNAKDSNGNTPLKAADIALRDFDKPNGSISINHKRIIALLLMHGGLE